MTSNQKKNKAEIHWSMTTMKNMILYLSIIILKQPNKIKNKEDLEEQVINLRYWIPCGVENIMHKTVHRRKNCSFITTKRG